MSLKLKPRTRVLSDVAVARLKAVEAFQQELTSSLIKEMRQNGSLGETKRTVKRYVA